MDNIAKDSSISKKAKIFWVALIFIAIVSTFSLYFLGYRFKDNFTLGKSGVLKMTVPLPETSIFIDNSQKIITSKENEVIELTLSPKTHNIIVGRDRYFPWTKNFVVPSEKTIELHPIFVSQNASGQIITQNDPEYWAIRSKIIHDMLPTKNSPIKSSDDSKILWVKDNAIMVGTTSSSTKVIEPDTIIKNVSFYKNRNDAVIFSTTDSIYVIETDTSSTQNFMPIYKGTSPSFIKDNPDFIYVFDGGTLMQVII